MYASNWRRLTISFARYVCTPGMCSRLLFAQGIFCCGTFLSISNVPVGLATNEVSHGVTKGTLAVWLSSVNCLLLPAKKSANCLYIISSALIL